MNFSEAQKKLREMLGGAYTQATKEYAEELAYKFGGVTHGGPVTDDEGIEWIVVASTSDKPEVWAAASDSQAGEESRALLRDDFETLLVGVACEHDHDEIKRLVEIAQWELVPDDNCQTVVVRMD